MEVSKGELDVAKPKFLPLTQPAVDQADRKKKQHRDRFAQRLRAEFGFMSRESARDATPLHILVFIGGSMVATSQTNGERPDVTSVIGLSFGTEKNVAFSFKFNCSPGVQPVVVGVGEKGQYIPLESKKCP